MNYFKSYFEDGSILTLKFSFCFIKSCFLPRTVLIFCFYLYLNLCLAHEFTYCHIRNVIRLAMSVFFTGDRACGIRADFRYLVLFSCGCA